MRAFFACILLATFCLNFHAQAAAIKTETACGPSTLNGAPFSVLESQMVILQNDKKGPVALLINLETCGYSRLDLSGFNAVEDIKLLNNNEALLVSYSQSQLYRIKIRPKLDVIAQQKMDGVHRVFVDKGSIYISSKQGQQVSLSKLSDDLTPEYTERLESQWDLESVADGKVLALNHLSAPNTLRVFDASSGKSEDVVLKTAGSRIITAKNNVVLVRGQDSKDLDKVYAFNLETKQLSLVVDMSDLSVFSKTYWVLDAKFNGNVVAVQAGWSNSITGAEGVVMLLYNLEGKLLNKPKAYKLSIGSSFLSFNEESLSVLSFGPQTKLTTFTLKNN